MRDSLRQNDDSSGSDVRVQIPCALVLERGSIVHFNLEPSTIDVEFLAVTGHPKTEANPAGDFLFLRDVVGCQVKRPELTAFIPVVSIRDDGVCPLLVWLTCRPAMPLGAGPIGAKSTCLVPKSNRAKPNTLL